MKATQALLGIISSARDANLGLLQISSGGWVGAHPSRPFPRLDLHHHPGTRPQPTIRMVEQSCQHLRIFVNIWCSCKFLCTYLYFHILMITVHTCKSLRLVMTMRHFHRLFSEMCKWWMCLTMDNILLTVSVLLFIDANLWACAWTTAGIHYYLSIVEDVRQCEYVCIFENIHEIINLYECPQMVVNSWGVFVST